ncbi:peptidoglycan-recognition protein 3-like [Chrysoperla carnea]|uniref:peptidoglycan-recognition protein 3-like n=1 Tax=Chrysoperla carnea TaxID=189513 RepID=UPI001D0655A0|nr:peptidoglycan-recognition protein 3-like [Chrysoperla carnea]
MMASFFVNGSTNPGEDERYNERTPLIGQYPIERTSYLGIAFLAACLFIGSFIGIYLLIVDGQNWEVRTIPYIYISRAAWRAQPPRVVYPLRPPIMDIFITHTNTSTCLDYDCMRLVRHQQILHMFQDNMTDIAYNFLVSEGGVVYEGRGWETQSEVWVNRNHTLSIALIGSYEKTSPPKKQLQETKLLIDECVQWKQVARCYKVIFDPKLMIDEKLKKLFMQSKYCT